MKSCDVLREAISEVGVKAIAADMRLSTSLIYKWCQPHESPTESGADNPLDRVARLYESTGDTRIIEWLCQEADGFFVNNPNQVESVDAGIFSATQSILKEFSELLDVVGSSYRNDGFICTKEAEKIRAEWEDLKRIGESFVNSCEAGVFAEQKPAGE